MTEIDADTQERELIEGAEDLPDAHDGEIKDDTDEAEGD